MCSQGVIKAQTHALFICTWGFVAEPYIKLPEMCLMWIPTGHFRHWTLCARVFWCFLLLDLNCLLLEMCWIYYCSQRLWRAMSCCLTELWDLCYHKSRMKHQSNAVTWSDPIVPAIRSAVIDGGGVRQALPSGLFAAARRLFMSAARNRSQAPVCGARLLNGTKISILTPVKCILGISSLWLGLMGPVLFLVLQQWGHCV